MTAPLPTLPLGRVRLPNGSTIAYRDFGGPDPVLVLLPGWACVQAMWEPAAAFLNSEFRVVSLDFAGFGQSTAGSCKWTIQEFAENVRAVMENLQLREVFLVGHSMGGAVALEAARLCNDRVVAVIGCDSFTYGEVYKRADEVVISDALSAYGNDFAGTVQAGISAYLLETSDPTLVTTVMATMTNARPDHALPAMEHLLRWDIDEALAGCLVPVASVNARAFLKAEAEREYGDRIAIETIAGVGHFLLMERPEEVATVLKRVVNSMRAAREKRP